jgi:hypothetical protein
MIIDMGSNADNQDFVSLNAELYLSIRVRFYWGLFRFLGVDALRIVINSFK